MDEKHEFHRWFQYIISPNAGTMDGSTSSTQFAKVYHPRLHFFNSLGNTECIYQKYKVPRRCLVAASASFIWDCVDFMIPAGLQLLVIFFHLNLVQWFFQAGCVRRCLSKLAILPMMSCLILRKSSLSATTNPTRYLPNLCTPTFGPNCEMQDSQICCWVCGEGEVSYSITILSHCPRRSLCFCRPVCKYVYKKE